MKYLKILAPTVFVFATFCSPKDMNNNQHEAAPTLELYDGLQANGRADFSEVESLFQEVDPLIRSGEKEKIILGLKKLEGTVLNKKLLEDPEVYSDGSMDSRVKRVFDLYGFGMSYLIHHKLVDSDAKILFDRYAANLFENCNSQNRLCEDVRPYKSAYGVNILHFILAPKVKEALSDKSFDEQSIRDLLFKLNVLDGFNEAQSSLTASLFIQFSSVFFRLSKQKPQILEQEDYQTYMGTLTNFLVRDQDKGISESACSVFEVIDLEEVKAKRSVYKKSFVNQISKLFYRCREFKEIYSSIKEETSRLRDKKIQALKDVQDSIWNKNYRDIHSRGSIIRSQRAQFLSNFGIGKSPGLPILYLLDQMYYGELDTPELESLIDKMSQEVLVRVVEAMEVYAKENLFYNIHFTYETFRSLAEESFKNNGGINDKFVEATFNRLYSRTIQKWKSLDKNINRLNTWLSYVYGRISQDEQDRLKEAYEKMNSKSLTSAYLFQSINIYVTFPIVLAATYLAGSEGAAGTMNVNFSFFSGSDKGINLPTENTLRDFFTSASQPQPLFFQMVDFGAGQYDPNRWERNIAFASVIQAGFFNVVNLDMEHPERFGLENNLKVFFDQYVKDNSVKAQAYRDVRKDLEDYIKYDWVKVREFCEKPLTGMRINPFSSIHKSTYMFARSDKGSSFDDLAYVKKVAEFRSKLREIDTELRGFQRIFKIADDALRSIGVWSQSFVDNFSRSLLSHVSLMKQLNDDVESKMKELEFFEGQKSRCLEVVQKMDRLHQNVLIKESAKHSLHIYAALQILEAAQALEVDSGFVEIRDWLQEKLEKSEVFQGEVIEKLLAGNALEQVEKEKAYKGERLLQEALNLSLLPHNFAGNFGIPIYLVDKVQSLRHTRFMEPLGGFGFLDDEGTRVNGFYNQHEFDVKMRIRSSAQKMTVKAGLLMDHFDSDPRVMKDLPPHIKRNQDVRLNSFQAKIETHESSQFYIKERNGSHTYRQKEIPFINSEAGRQAFLRASLEGLLGNNQNNKNTLNWTSIYRKDSPISELFDEDMKAYQYGPIVIPKSIDFAKPDFSCLLNSDFRTRNLPPDSPCFLSEIPPRKIVRDHIRNVDLMFEEESSMPPLSFPGESLEAKRAYLKASGYYGEGSSDLDEVSEEQMEADLKVNELVADILFRNENILFYEPSNIKSWFTYHLYKDEPRQWTWMDQFLASSFTSSTRNSVTFTPSVKGKEAYHTFFDAMEKLKKHEDLLFPPDRASKNRLRQSYRSDILHAINNAEDIIHEIRKAERTMPISQFPPIATRWEEIDNIQYANKKGFVFVNLEEREDGSVGLLAGLETSYELNAYRKAKTEAFRDFGCEVLPQKRDGDFDILVDRYVNKDNIECKNFGATRMARRYIEAQECLRDLRLQQDLALEVEGVKLVNSQVDPNESLYEPLSLQRLRCDGELEELEKRFRSRNGR